MSAILYKDNPYGGTTTVTDAGHVLVTQGSGTTTAQAKFNTQTTAIQRILGNFATVEQSTTASKAYNVGDYLVLNSFLYKVTQIIAAGDTIDNTQNGNVVKTNAGAEFKNANSPVMELTKAQYDALPESVKNDGTIYLITDGTGGWEAEDSVYDNTESGLTATNVQDAIDELNSKSISKAFQAVTGQYTTAVWARGTNTATWTASEDGLYIAWMRFELHDPTTKNKNIYKQLQFTTNGTALMNVNQYYDSPSDTTFGNYVVRTICMPFILKAGNTITPYVHTGKAGIVFDIQICAVKLGG